MTNEDDLERSDRFGLFRSMYRLKKIDNYITNKFRLGNSYLKKNQFD